MTAQTAGLRMSYQPMVSGHRHASRSFSQEWDSMHCQWRWMGAISAAAIVLAMFASAATPTLSPSGIDANEAEAIATLRSIAAAQLAFKAAVDLDTNCDGMGEYGYFGELAGAVPMRVCTAGHPDSGVYGVDELDPPLLRSRLGNVFGGCVEYHGYLFQLRLPGPKVGGAVNGIDEDWTGGKLAGPYPDPGNGGRMWCCYAWPIVYDQTGRGAFVINQRGRVFRYANRNPSPFSGLSNTPSFDEAFLVPYDMSSPLRIGIAGGAAGSVWWPVH